MNVAAWDGTSKGGMDPVVKQAAGLGAAVAASGSCFSSCLHMLHAGRHVALCRCAGMWIDMCAGICARMRADL